MGFPKIDLTGSESRILKSLPNHPLLGRSVGCRQTAARAVVIDRDASNESHHRVAVAKRFGVPLEHEDDAPFTSCKTICRGIESLASPIGSENSHTRKGQEGI